METVKDLSLWPFLLFSVKQILFLFIPFVSSAQHVTFHEAAGIKPIHFESFSGSGGVIDVWSGPFAVEGQFVKVFIPMWEQIDCIYGNVISKNENFDFKIKVTNPTSLPSNQWFGLEKKHVNTGEWTRINFVVKYKKV